MEYTPPSILDKIQAKTPVDNPGRPSTEVPPSISVPSLTLNDLSIALTSAAPQLAALASSRLAALPKSSKSQGRRPSTASSAEEKSSLLPSSSVPKEFATPSPCGSEEDMLPLDGLSSYSDEMSIHEMNRRAHAAVAGLRAEASRLAGVVDTLPSPFDPSPTDDQLAQSLHDASRSQLDCDWATFIHAYAFGRWDPLKTPQPPRSHINPPTHSHARTAEGLDTCDSPESASSASPPERDDGSASHNESNSSTSNPHTSISHSAPAQYHESNLMPTVPGKSALPVSPDAGIASRRSTVPLKLGFHRLRSSFGDVRSQSVGSPGGTGAVEYARPLNITNTDAATTAAAIRLAAARVSVAPLALPSPEHELTDPMRGVTATIPGSHPSDLISEPLPKSPATMRKTRLSSFWQGTQDIEDARLPTIEASPPETTDEGGIERETTPKGFVPPPATAPIKISSESDVDDYFGALEPPKPEVNHVDRPGSTSGQSHSDVDVKRHSSAPPLDYEPATVPALPRRICLTRQTSAPLPTLVLQQRRLRSARPASESAILSQAGRSAKEEQMFAELGYLAPPNPPDELERRRALYKFNIWNTGHDVNFDRIVHLVKLVFNTRIVALSLLDGTEEFIKSESGWGAQNMPRTTSFNAHAILQRDDEPTIVLDVLDDWRFAQNPLVTDHPHVRFYAGCPLRTQDGYNIGTLCLIDDTPRREFSPRQRHTLKEFAQITMRELELWRDKIQLRIRDRIQNSMEEFTRECLEVDKDLNRENRQGQGLFVGTSMEQIYERAARLVKRTLDVEGAIVMDVSHVDVLETVGAESSTSITIHNADPQIGTAARKLNADECTKLQDFFSKYPDGKICEGVLPSGLRPFLPSRIQYALSVPIFNIDKRPFAILCAYSTGEHTTPYLEGHELSYLRAIGVIILSAVLKRRMMLADKAKSLFISNISHELRTPLHGILASAELLSDTHLDHSQASFLQTVQACGTSLVETVNHVLDFTKLSGNSRSGGVENVIERTKVDLMQLVEEATEGCWIGHRARMFTSEIGSVYSPPKQGQSTIIPVSGHLVETVIDIGHSSYDWVFKCEKGGIRRVLMNLFGNSLKFTKDGYVHVKMRQIPSPTPGQVKIELSVEDTGKGISQSFLKNHLFHPFSQENPLQTGTGLGLAIVNSIVRSQSVDGKVDVWSEEGQGTEIKITFTAECIKNEETCDQDAELVKISDILHRPSVSLIGFDDPHRGVQLLRQVITSYLVDRWGLSIAQDPDEGDIVIANEDPTWVMKAVAEGDRRPPAILLSSSRGDSKLMNLMNDYEIAGGFCRIIFKPVGPHRLWTVLKLCLHALHISQARSINAEKSNSSSPGSYMESTSDGGDVFFTAGSLSRRYSEERTQKASHPLRPHLGPRAATAHPLSSWSDLIETAQQKEPEEIASGTGISLSQSPSSPTVSIGSGGSLLKTSIGCLEVKGPLRILVVEDNAILRNLLTKWLKTKGYDFREAVDGLDGVHIFESDGRFDVVLVDLSMPVLDGIGATARMRELEASWMHATDNAAPAVHPAKILALTGMSSLEDKRKAFEAGVDGYLVKPVAFKTLDLMFQKLGVL